jgi:hypothetical protein
VSLRRRGADQRFTSVSSGLPGIASDPLPPAGPGGAGSGGVAQLGERLLCKQEVIGSIPFTSTNRSGTERLVPLATAHCAAMSESARRDRAIELKPSV